MKRPPKKKKKVRLTGLRRLKQKIKDAVHACHVDIEYYIVNDIMRLLKRQGVIYVKNNKKKH